MLNKIKNRLTNKKGFTLVELIVVIVIILILAAVLVPNVTRYVANARTASLKSDASAILTQVQADYTAYVAGVDSNIEEDTTDPNTLGTDKVNGVTVTIINGTVSDPSEGDATAKYDATKSEIIEFRYTKGGKTITWTPDDGWNDPS